MGLLLVGHAASGQLISNGGFEDGLAPGSPPAQWNTTGDFFHWTNPGKAHMGSQYAYSGIAADGTTPLTNGSGSIEQSISFIIPTRWHHAARHASGISWRDLSRDGSWGPPGGHSHNWHGQRG
jgi:hypothetical protein